MGKKIGRYINIEIADIYDKKSLIKPVSGIIAAKLSGLLPAESKDGVMIIGLGNERAAADSLGPRTVKKALATRHIKYAAPAEMPDGIASLCVLSPGVLGVNGIETAEIIKGTAQKVKPGCIIAVDALAAGNISRIGTNIQIADTGIQPGSGISNNTRQSLNKKTLGVPVIAIGVPTVVDSQIIIHEALSGLLRLWREEWKENHSAYYESATSAAREILRQFGGGLIVTLGEIDTIADKMADLLAASIVRAVHPGANENNYHLFLN
jgi:spore protease